MSDLDAWPALTRAIEPLPGGLDALRATLRAEEAAVDELARAIEPLPGGLDALRANVRADADAWDAVARDVAPLPGGLARLRRTLRARAARARIVPLAFAGVVAAAIAIAIVTRSAPAQADRTAMKQLLGGPQPHPGAAALGLVDAPPQVEAAADPRIADPVVVFRWVSPTPGL
jgi:hypothetical protein